MLSLKINNAWRYEDECMNRWTVTASVPPSPTAVDLEQIKNLLWEKGLRLGGDHLRPPTSEPTQLKTSTTDSVPSMSPFKFAVLMVGETNLVLPIEKLSCMEIACCPSYSYFVELSTPVDLDSAIGGIIYFVEDKNAIPEIEAMSYRDNEPTS